MGGDGARACRYDAGCPSCACQYTTVSLHGRPGHSRDVMIPPQVSLHSGELPTAAPTSRHLLVSPLHGCIGNDCSINRQSICITQCVGIAASQPPSPSGMSGHKQNSEAARGLKQSLTLCECYVGWSISTGRKAVTSSTFTYLLYCQVCITQYRCSIAEGRGCQETLVPMPVTMPVQRRQSGTSAALLAGAQPVQSAQEQQTVGFVSRHASFDSSSGANTPSGEAYRKVFMAPWTTSDQVRSDPR